MVALEKAVNPFCDLIINKQVQFDGGTGASCSNASSYTLIIVYYFDLSVLLTDVLVSLFVLDVVVRKRR